jgi:hypothetical protein
MTMQSLPMTSIFVLSFLLGLLITDTGYRIGVWMTGRSTKEQPAQVGGMVGAVLALLAFMLAFTFGLAGNVFQAKRETVLAEANAIGTAYLRADLLPEQRGAAVRDLLREYVDVRLEAVRTGNIDEAVARSEALHGRLWEQAMAAAAERPDSVMVGLFIQALNEVIDLHSTRMQIGVRTRIPGTIWISLLVIAAMGLGSMGYQTGLSGSSRSIVIVAVSLAFSIVIWLIADLDRGREGLLRVDQRSMIDLQRSMSGPPS